MAGKNKLIHTPEGVRDSYSSECRRKLAVEEKILETFYLCGYEHLQTPSFEFFDVFSEERGSVSSRQMFKFFDRDNNTLVLRPDMTPAVARCVAKYFMDDEMPLRLCYLERTFKNDGSYQGRLKERTETGAELIGDDSADADAEMIALVIEGLRAAGLQEFQVELGEAGFYRSLLEEAGFTEEAEEELNRLIDNKNDFGVEEFLARQSLSRPLRAAFQSLPALFGPIDRIRRARELSPSPRALAAIERLEQVYGILAERGLADYVSFDLGMVSGYRYYTGIVFKAYTYGTGDYIGTGGRYDRLLAQFGKDTPAVGFAIVIDRLMAALSRQDIEIPLKPLNTVVLYQDTARPQGLALASFLRRKGMAVQCMLLQPGQGEAAYRRMAEKRGLRNLLILEGGGQTVKAVDLVAGSEDLIPYSAYAAEEGRA